MTEDQVRTDITYVRSKLMGRDGKYNRNLDLYQYNGYRMSDIWEIYGAPAGYINPLMGPDGPITQYNFTKSIVDAFVSKISDAKVRPFFNPVEGTYETRKAAKQAQERFDDIYDDQQVYSKSVYAMRDSFVFERGDIWINDITGRIQKIMPWNYERDPAEYAAEVCSRCTVRQKQYPFVALLDRVKLATQSTKSDLMSRWEQNRALTGEYTVYYDLYNGERFEFFENLFLCKEKIKFASKNGLMTEPMVEFWYNKPVKGYFSTSMVDDLYTLQWGRDNMQRRFDQAVRRGLFNFILIPAGSELKKTDIENGAATAYDFLPGGEAGGAPQVVTPQFVHAQLIQILDLYEQWAMKMVGLSGLDVHAEKQPGLDSGKAIQTMENIASDRHNTILQMFVHKQVEIAQKIIDIMPDNASILPKKLGRADITWSEIRKSRDLIEIQFSAGSVLSKDPATKSQQIDQMMATGVFDANRKAQFMEMPDLEEAYSLATVSSDYTDWIIDKWASGEEIDFIPVVSLEMLRTEIQKAMMRYSMAGDGKEIQSRLTELLNRVTSYEDEASKGMGPGPASTPGIPAPPIPTGPMPPVPNVPVPPMQ